MALRVLLADESSTIKRVMQLALQDFAVEVKSVPVGLDVLPVTKTFKPDIVFADVLLTKRNGYEVCQDLKNDSETKNIPVVLMWSGFMEIDEAKISVANARLEKPFDAETLRQMVQDLVPKTQSNTVSPYLQFPKMPEFSEGPQKTAPAATATPASGKIPTAAPIDFDKFDPTHSGEESIFSIPEENTDGGFHSMPIEPEEEFTSVPLKSSQQKDQHEEDGWTQQDLKRFKIQTPEESEADKSFGHKEEEDFASKFVIPQESYDTVQVKDDGEFEELSFSEDLTSTKASAPTPAAEPVAPRPAASANPQVSTKPSSPGVSLTADQAMIERVIREEVREVIESICWKVLPEMTERIVREEIQKILRDVEKSV